MTLGAAIFASVVLVLLVYNKPFRKASAWVAGVLAGIILVGGLGWYAYGKYQDYSQAKQAALHKKLVDACIARFSTSGYGKTDDEWVDYIDVPATCENDPNQDWSSKSKSAPNAPDNKVVEIHGGETLKIVRSKSTGAPTAFDMSKSVPIVYLGHNQKFQLACGNFGEQGNYAPTFKQGEVSCCTEMDEKGRCVSTSR